MFGMVIILFLYLFVLSVAVKIHLPFKIPYKYIPLFTKGQVT